MPDTATLFDKTFDQQREIVGNKAITTVNISPNRLVAAEIVFEPLLGGVRVTARDANHHMLWGFVGSKSMMTQQHTPVAVYDRLRKLLDEELTKHKLEVTPTPEAIESAKAAIKGLQDTLCRLQEAITVKKPSPATYERAEAIGRTIRDVSRQIDLELNTGKASNETDEEVAIPA